MGVQQITAEAYQRLTPKPSARSESRSDRSSEDFETFLDKARSARKTEDEAQDESVAPADESREANEAADASEDAVAETSAPIVVNIPTPDAGGNQSEQNAADAADGTMPKVGQPATEQTDTTTKPTVQEGTLPLATQADQQNAAADSDSEQTAAQSNQAAKTDNATNVAQRHDAIAANASAKSSGAQATKDAAEAPVTQQSGNATKENADTRSEQSAQQQKDAGRPVAEQNPQANQNDSNAGERQTQQQSAQQKTDQTRNAGDVNEPTLHEQKIAASVEERRRGDADAPQAQSQQAAQAKPTTAVSERLDVMAERVDAKSEATPTAVKVISGDSAAESLGRFLLDAGHSNAGNGAAGTASTATVSTSSATSSTSASAQAGTTFADTLAASTDAPESLGNAARTFQASGGNGRYQVTMQIDPPDLGQIRLQVKMQNQGLTLQVDAESSSVAKLLESRLSQLRDALAAHGIRVERADVVVKSPSGTETNTHHQNQNSGRHAGTHGTGDSYGDLPGDSRHTHGSQDEPQQGADWRSNVDTDSETNARADGVDASRGWTNRTATTELSLDLVA